MMKKKVKKIPKYYEGTTWADMNKNQRTGAVIDAAGTALTNAIGSIGKPVTAAGVINGGLSGAQVGAAIGGPVGAGIGFAGGALLSSIGNKASTDGMGNVTYSSGITRLLGIGKSDEEIRRQANLEKNSILSRTQTQNLQLDYHNENPTGSINVLAAEGGIIRKPVDALVSKGELIYNPMTKKLSKVPGSKGKPNKADDVYARLYEGDVVISNSPTMLMSNGKTPAQNLEGLVDKYSTGGTVKAREAIIKKVVNWQEANKTKLQEYAKFDDGGIAKYRYNKNLSDFAYWDKDKNEYKKEYLDWVNNITEQDVRDIEAGKYGDMTEYFSKNKGKKLDVATAQKLMTDKKYGNWHKIGQAIVDNKIKTSAPPTVIDSYQLPIKGGTISEKEFNFTDSGKPLITHRIPYIDKNLKKLANPSKADGIVAAYKEQNKGNGTPDWLSNIADFAPMAAALFGDYDYHTESSQITPPRFVPVNADPRPLLRAADESLAMARYNQANISPNTGAGMAYGLQAASNRAKTYADAYQWQQETNNKLIAQNAGIYNDWRKQRDAYATQAIADTRANEAAAQQMRDSAIRDAYEFTTGRRNDRWKLSMLEPMFKYAVDDNIWKNFRV